MVLTRQKRWAEAEQAFSEAKELAGRIGYPYAHGRVLQAYGVMLLAQGEEQKARWAWDEGLAIFRRLGAVRDVEAMVDELMAFADSQLLSDGQQ